MRLENDYNKTSQVQKGYEYFYLGSKTTSSTTVLPSSPKKIKHEIENEKNQINENLNIENNNFIIEEETESCHPSLDQMKQSEINLNSQILSEVNTSKTLFSHNVNQHENQTNPQSILNLNQTNNLCEKKFVTKENFPEKFQNILNNSNSNQISNINASASGSQGIFNNNNGNLPHFNYAKFQEAQKMIQLNSENSTDSKSNNLVNASTTSNSPEPSNNIVNLEIKPSYYNNLNMFFGEDYLPRNTFRNNCKFLIKIKMLF